MAAQTAATATAARARAEAARAVAEARGAVVALRQQRGELESQLRAARVRLNGLLGERQRYQAWKRAQEAAAAREQARQRRIRAESAARRAAESRRRVETWCGSHPSGTTATSAQPDRVGDGCRRPERRSSPAYPVGMARLGLLVSVCSILLAGCAGSDGASRTPDAASETPTHSSTASRLADPAEFERLIAEADAIAVNVHVPDEGSLPGTDLAVPYTEVRTQASRFPADRGTPLAVYCRTGRMSAEAAQALVQLGYRNVVDLRGGMEAWTASGRPLLPPLNR